MIRCDDKSIADVRPHDPPLPSARTGVPSSTRARSRRSASR